MITINTRTIYKNGSSGMEPWLNLFLKKCKKLGEDNHIPKMFHAKKKGENTMWGVNETYSKKNYVRGQRHPQ
jgi:hypothetical protein